MSNPPLNKEARIHRMLNQRRIAFSLIERIQTLLAPRCPFNRELAQLFREQGKFGAKDRRLYRELIFTYLRYQPWLDRIRSDEIEFVNTLIILASPIAEVRDLYPTLGDNAPEDSEFSNRHRLIGKSDDDIQELLPAWFLPHFNARPDIRELLVFFQRAPLWLRIQKGDPSEILDEIESLSAGKDNSATLSLDVPNALQAPTGLPLANLDAYQSGKVEVQDISSQILLQLLDPEPAGKWLDACAGAGGKTLQLAKMLGNYGHVVAYDSRQNALKELEARQKRAGLSNIKISPNRPSQRDFDGVLIDAPCSGSGTWRRHPFLMRQLLEKDVMDFAEKQISVMEYYANRVNDGGRLVYATCSLSRFENEHVVETFLDGHSEFEHDPLGERFGLKDHGRGITIYPALFNGDGLYIAALRKKESR